MAELIRGRCLCGGVRYEIDGPLPLVVHCHCSRCRHWTGAATYPAGVALTEKLRITQGEELLRTYREPPFSNRTFCTRCGSKVFEGEWPDGPRVNVALGPLEGAFEVPPQIHVQVAYKAPWDEITDDFPQFPEFVGDA